MFQRLLITFGVICTSSFSFVPASLADSINVPFSGVVLDHASINFPEKLQPINSNYSNKSYNNLSVQIPLQFQVESSRGTSITVSSPQFKSVSLSNQLESKYTQSSNIIGSSLNNSNVGKKSISLSAGSNDLEMDILLKKPEAVTPRSYTHEIILTVTPQ